MERTTSLGEGRDLRNLISIGWRRKWVFVIPTLAGLLAGLVIGHPKILRPVYRASSMLLLDFPQQLGRDLEGMVVRTSGMNEQRARLQNLLQSNDFLLKTAETTGLRDDPAIRKWVSRGQRRYPDMTEEELIDLRITQWLRRVIRMDSQGTDRENVIVIQFEDYYPDRAQSVVQTLTRRVIETHRSTQLERVRTLHDFSLEQLVVYKQRLNDAEQKLEDFRRGIVVREVTANPIPAASAAEIPRLRQEASDELKRLSAERDRQRSTLATRSPNTAAAVRNLSDETWISAIREIADLERRYAQETVTPSAADGTGSETIAVVIGRKFQELKSLALAIVADATRSIPDSERTLAVDLMLAETRVTATEARVNAYDGILNDLHATVEGTPHRETTLNRLTEEVETNRALYNAFVQQLAASQISEAFEATMAAGRLTVLEPASRPLSPVKPNRMAVVILSTTIGLLLGIAGLLVVERQDQTLRDSRETERSLGLRVLGTVPQIEGARRGSKGGNVIWNGSRLDEFLQDSPAYLEMRRVILQLRGEEESLVRSLLVTSSRGGEGKTTCSILMAAAAAAEEPRTPVLLVDLDLRRGTLGGMLGIEDEPPGVVQALEGQRIEEGWFLRTSIPNLRALTLGSRPAPRNDLLTFENLSWFLPELTRRYGFVVIDSPPNLPVPDPLIIGQLVDAVMLVIKAGSTPRNLVERSVELQKQFTGNLRGLLMNNVDEMMPYYYSYRYYRYPSSPGKPPKRNARVDA